MSISRLRMGIDGKGVTSLVSSPGCPLRCRFCINKKLLSDPKPEPVTAEELCERLRRDDLYFRATGGGITFGGGESLLQAAFYAAFRLACPAEWRLCAETSLAVPRELVATAAESIDEFIVDCKDMDAGIYREYTGGELSLMEDNLRFLLDRVGAERVVVRVPLIPGFNDEGKRRQSVEQLKRMGVSRLDLFDYVVRE